MSECKFCGRLLSSKHNLKTHQTTAKYCLKIQGKRAARKYKCRGCKKGFELRHHYKQHTSKCAKYEIRGYKREIRHLKEELNNKNTEILKYRELYANNEGKVEILEKVVDQPRTKTINNTQQNNYVHPKLASIPITNIQPFTIETIRERIENGGYTYEMFTSGLQGITRFVNEIIIRDNIVTDTLRIEEIDESKEEDNEQNERNDGDDEQDERKSHERSYVCTDSSRNRFHRLLKSKEWVSDNGAHFLEKVLTELQPKAEEYYMSIINMMNKGKTEDDRMHMSKLQELTSPIYYGITRPKSADRVALFKKLRSEIRSIAAV